MVQASIDFLGEERDDAQISDDEVASFVPG